jgi:hypothetical protein
VRGGALDDEEGPIDPVTAKSGEAVMQKICDRFISVTAQHQNSPSSYLRLKVTYGEM